MREGYEHKDECKPTKLKYEKRSIIRGDSVILDSKQRIEDECKKVCSNYGVCIAYVLGHGEAL